MLTAERMRELLRYDSETGEFRWRESRGGSLAGTMAGTVRQDGYRRIRVDGALYLAHRLAWLWAHGVWPSGDIDHVNGIAGDDRLANLRDVSARVNLQNQRLAHRHNVVGLLGVSPKGRKFMAQISAEGRKRYIGLFESAETAHAAYLAAKRELHPGCTI